MLRLLLVLIVLAQSLTAFAYEITCSGQGTKAKLVLGLSNSAFLLNKAEYSFRGKKVPTAGYEFAIHGNKYESIQKVVYKFITLKKNALAKKNSDLTFTIKQNGYELDPRNFTLKDGYQAELRINDQGTMVLMDNMNCVAI